MSSIKVAILGFGTVGEGVYRTITAHQDKLVAALGKKVEVSAILLKNKHKDRGIDQNILVTDDFEDIFRLDEIDVVFEAIVGCEPANTYLRKAIAKGCHVITANKEMFAHHGSELSQLAKENGVSIGFEATVAGGVPVIQTIGQLLNVNRIQKIEGILNGTSNYILSEMRVNQLSFEEALSLAQEKGYAESDPTNDVEGFDAFYKLMILSEIAFGKKPDWESVAREGIRSISIGEIKQAEKLGLRFKLVASVQLEGENIIGSVRPTLVSASHPLFNIEGVENSVSIEGDIVGRISLQGPGAGMLPTASAMVEDLIHVVKGNHRTTVSSTGAAVEREVKAQSKKNWILFQPGNDLLARVPIDEAIATSDYLFFKADEARVLELQKQLNGTGIFEILGESEIMKEVIHV